LSNNINIRKSS